MFRILRLNMYLQNFLNEGRSSDKENMQAMYLEIVAVIVKEIERGKLPTNFKEN